MNVIYDVPVPKANGGIGNKWVDMLRDFTNSDHGSMCITLDDGAERNSATASFKCAIKRHGFNISVICRGTSVYLLKGGAK